MHGDRRHATDSGRERARAIPGVGRPPWLLPLVLLVAGLAVNLATPPSLLLGTAFGAAPLAAAALWTARGTLFTGIAAVLAYAAVLLRGGPGWTEGLLRLGAVAAFGVLALAVNHALRHGEQRFASVRQVAEAVQFAVLPVPPGRIGGLELAVRYEAAHAYARIGGDLYAVQRTPYGVRLLVGDVCGKGLDAVATVTVVLGAFREAAETEPDLAAVADRIDHALLRERSQRAGQSDCLPGGGAGRPVEFVTAVLAELPPGPAGEPESVRIVSRGHPPPLLLSAGGASVRTLEPDSYALPLGLGDMAGPADAPEGPDGGTGPVPFPPGALLLLHTDGVTEARNAEGVFYDPVARLRGRRFPGPGALLDALVADVHAHADGRTDDDMALLAVMRDPAPPPPPSRSGEPG
ncbi:PP2C family protein-serine/threonine phosphatase [Streptomyces sp. TRM 70361]|uniref:PP2C family protein-serine/threonine phosphatase n=1 Tax=Streptomyces sp. TRM 70361 TaxID=3116553 RepID=UPI002E7B24D7|nr:PP2C family protein-serine/threonine phosphatase [Streptomyces sp. TRM 70361]MEE1941659.1 PP2C family protein-serine/threonine phosphatase [Streptomyces sp. TRM 70361]